jgi:hypothetical protein
MAGKDIRAGGAFMELFLKDAKLRAGLVSASKRLKAWGASVRQLGLRVFAVGAAIAGGLGVAIKGFLDAGDALDKMRQRTGISVEALSELQHAAGQSGTNLETVEKAVAKMQKQLGSNLSTATADALKELGLNAKALQALSPEEQFTEIASAIGKVEDPTKRAGLALEIFGRSGTQLLPMIEDLDALRQEARDLGFVVSGEAAAASVKLGDQLANLWKTVTFGGHAIAEALIPELMAYAAMVQGALTTGLKWLQNNKQLVVTVGKVAAIIMGAGAALVALGAALSGLGIIAGGLASGLAVVGTAIGFLLSPLGLVIAGLTGGIAAWLAWTESGRNAITVVSDLFGSLWETFSQTLGGIMAALTSGDLSLAAGIAIEGVRLAFHQGFAALNELSGGWLESIKNGFVTAFAAMTFAVRNWSLLVRIAAQSALVGVVTFANETIHFLTVVIPSVLSWFANNWWEIFVDLVNITETVATNIWKNLTSLWDGIVGLFSGEGFSFEWTPLTEGFESAIKELPAIAEREIGPLEKALKDRLGELSAELATAWEQEKPVTTTPEQRLHDAQRDFDALRAALPDAARGLKQEQVKRDLAQVTSPEEAGGKVQGTFNTAAAALLGGGGSAAERTARNTEMIVKHTKLTSDKIDKLALKAGNG